MHLSKRSLGQENALKDMRGNVLAGNGILHYTFLIASHLGDICSQPITSIKRQPYEGEDVKGSLVDLVATIGDDTDNNF